MKTTTLIRVEHEDGYGMFCLYDADVNLRSHCVVKICNEISKRHEGNFPIPWDDEIDFTTSDFCAYKSIEQIQQWIMKDEFAVLFKNGYKVYLLEVSDCQMGNYQAAYKKQDIVLKKDISSLFV